MDLIAASQKLVSLRQALFDHHGVATFSFNAFNHAFLSETRALENATSIKSVPLLKLLRRNKEKSDYIQVETFSRKNKFSGIMTHPKWDSKALGRDVIHH